MDPLPPTPLQITDVGSILGRFTLVLGTETQALNLQALSLSPTPTITTLSHKDLIKFVTQQLLVDTYTPHYFVPNTPSSS